MDDDTYRNIYDLAFQAGDIISTAQQTWKLESFYDVDMADHLQEEQRLGHTHSLNRPDKPCYFLDKTDTVRCHYLFGGTDLVTTHAYGHCPWKMRRQTEE